jgi:transcription termination factor Rho
MSHYSKLITEATGETNPQRVADIEESMRQDVFHSTLDWQAKDHLFWGAREAVKILAALQA